MSAIRENLNPNETLMADKIAFAAQSTFEDARIAPQDDLFRLASAGVKVQDAPKEGAE